MAQPAPHESQRPLRLTCSPLPFPSSSPPFCSLSGVGGWRFSCPSCRWKTGNRTGWMRGVCNCSVHRSLPKPSGTWPIRCAASCVATGPYQRCHGAVTTLPRGRNNVATGRWQRTGPVVRTVTALGGTRSWGVFSHIPLLSSTSLCPACPADGRHFGFFLPVLRMGRCLARPFLASSLPSSLLLLARRGAFMRIKVPKLT